MTESTNSSSQILDELLQLTNQLRSKKDHQPTENPVLTLAQKINQKLESNDLTTENLKENNPEIKRFRFFVTCQTSAKIPLQSH